MKLLGLLLVLFLAVAGCTLVSNVSSEPGFSHFVGRDIELTSPVLICRDEPLTTENGSTIELELSYRLNSSKCAFGETIGALPPGSKIRVTNVEKHKVLSVKPATHIYFLGTSHKLDGGAFDFYYFYGFEDHYGQQPWAQLGV